MMWSVIIEEMEGLIETNQDANAGNIAGKISLLQAMTMAQSMGFHLKEPIQDCWKETNLEEYWGIASEFIDDKFQQILTI